MTRDEIIRIAEHSEFGMPIEVFQFSAEELERFAALIVAHEREACAKVCEKLPETFRIAADEFGYEAETPTAENYAAAIRTRDDT